MHSGCSLWKVFLLDLAAQSGVKVQVEISVDKKQWLCSFCCSWRNEAGLRVPWLQPFHDVEPVVLVLPAQSEAPLTFYRSRNGSVRAAAAPSSREHHNALRRVPCGARLLLLQTAALTWKPLCSCTTISSPSGSSSRTVSTSTTAGGRIASASSRTTDAAPAVAAPVTRGKASSSAGRRRPLWELWGHLRRRLPGKVASTACASSHLLVMVVHPDTILRLLLLLLLLLLTTISSSSSSSSAAVGAAWAAATKTVTPTMK